MNDINTKARPAPAFTIDGKPLIGILNLVIAKTASDDRRVNIF